MDYARPGLCPLGKSPRHSENKQVAYGNRQPDFLVAAQNALGDGHFVQCEQLASQGLSFAPLDVPLLMCRGHAFFQLEDYPRALADYSQVIKLSSRDAEAYACRGVCYSEMKYHERALADLTFAVQLDPRRAGGWSNRGRVLHDLQRYEEALHDHRRSVELAPDRSDYYYRCGEECLYLLEHEAAIGYFNRAIELNPREATYYTDRGACHFHLDQYERALADLNCAIGLRPKTILAYFFRGRTWLKLHDKRQAFDDLTTFIAREPTWGIAFFERGKLFSEAGRFAEAAADFSAAIQIRPDDLALYRERAKAYRGLGQSQLAERDLKFRDDAVRRQVADVSSRGVRVSIPIVQAFSELHSTKYDGDAYAATILSFDPALVSNIERMRAIGRDVSRLKGTWPDDPQARRVARILTKELGERHRRVRIPAAFTGGPVAYLADVWIYRPFLPLGKLDGSWLLHCVAEPGDAGRIELLPQPMPAEDQ